MISIVILTHNRLDKLQTCVQSIRQTTFVPYEIIIVDNASTDGTGAWILQQVKDSIISDTCNVFGIYRQFNEGVCSRNYGFDIARYPFIAQIDDDVIMRPGWDKISLDYFNNQNIGMVGPQGGLIDGWLNLHVFQHNDSYVDFLTGYFFVMRNCGIRYDTKFNPFWHEELHLSLQFKERGYKLRMIPNYVCVHASARQGEVDWQVHDRNFNYVRDEWKDKTDVLRLGGR